MALGARCLHAVRCRRGRAAGRPGGAAQRRRGRSDGVGRRDRGREPADRRLRERAAVAAVGDPRHSRINAQLPNFDGDAPLLIDGLFLKLFDPYGTAVARRSCNDATSPSSSRTAGSSGSSGPSDVTTAPMPAPSSCSRRATRPGPVSRAGDGSRCTKRSRPPSRTGWQRCGTRSLPAFERDGAVRLTAAGEDTLAAGALPVLEGQTARPAPSTRRRSWRPAKYATWSSRISSPSVRTTERRSGSTPRSERVWDDQTVGIFVRPIRSDGGA